MLDKQETTDYTDSTDEEKTDVVILRYTYPLHFIRAIRVIRGSLTSLQAWNGERLRLYN